MKRLKIIYVLILIICFGCIGTEGSTINKNYLIGSWASTSDGNIDFIIGTKSIQYFEDIEDGINCLGTYKIKGSIFTPFDCSGYLIANYEIISLSQDSMKWKTEDGSILKFIKRQD